MELVPRIGALLLLLLCFQNSQVVICQTASTAEVSTATAEPDTTSTPSVTTSAEAVTTATETVTPSAEPVTSESTPEPQTTVTPGPTSAPSVPKHYDGKTGNITCFVMDATFVFNIPYVKTDKEDATARVPIPVDATFEGECKSDNTELLVINFFNNTWKFTVDIETDVNQTDDSLLMADENVNYSWRELTLVYVMDDHFPDAIDAGESKNVKAVNQHLFDANTQGSYKCKESQNFDIEKNVTLAVSDFQYRAFGTTDSEAYPDSGVNECPADKKKDDDDDTGKIVGIVVGSVVGGLIIITIIGCLIQRARKRGSYEKV